MTATMRKIPLRMPCHSPTLTALPRVRSMHQATEIRSSAQRVTAIDAEALAGDPRRVGPGEERDRGGDVGHGPEAPERHLGRVVRSRELVRREGIRGLRWDQTRPHRIHSDAVRAELIGGVRPVAFVLMRALYM
jgi:hypothetical protein